ncbi:YbhB/YbcL family Raf kinase inhibitor-like protein [Nocardia arthritidis]|uniref:YbhB/YbcL family Raf kinase inhibitor-like protein n=1 Tax=Nocardia arthritidis TaxID=228602 RepID=A0A6G9YI34_9NOCA|nr:YbhB/YbcL family Raf kinase inhibitor-like protein [Nocardia arthritidis]QIS12844.1 YbhB/YbcL family Raf kinase inhibitor-like protein [Nocardia arthritidis]
MSVLGKLLANKRAGDEGLAWNRPNLAGGSTFRITSPDFEHESHLNVIHAGKRLGGQDRSPALTWSPPPAETAQLLLAIEDPDAPMKTPFVHAVALLDPTLGGLPQNGLAADDPAPGALILRSGWGRGYMGPAPIKGHGPHRYVFQLFALAEPITTGKSLESAKPAEVLAAGRALARARIDAFYERG